MVNDETYSVSDSTETGGDSKAPLKRHGRFYHEDGMVELFVDGSLYNIHSHFLTQHSSWFRERIGCAESDVDAAGLPSGWERIDGPEDVQAFVNYDLRRASFAPPALPKKPAGVLVLEDTTQADFDALLSIFYPKSLIHGDITTQDEWEAILKLSTRFSFPSLRQRALRELDSLVSSFDRLLIARVYNINHWVEEALHGLCTRNESLSLDEICQMRLEDVAFVAETRERARASEDLNWEDLLANVDEMMGRRRQAMEGGKSGKGEEDDDRGADQDNDRNDGHAQEVSDTTSDHEGRGVMPEREDTGWSNVETLGDDDLQDGDLEVGEPGDDAEEVSAVIRMTVVATELSSEPEEIKPSTSSTKADSADTDGKSPLLSPVAESTSVVTASMVKGSASPIPGTTIGVSETYESLVLETKDDDSIAGDLPVETMLDATQPADVSSAPTDLSHDGSGPSTGKLPLPSNLRCKSVAFSHHVEYLMLPEPPSSHDSTTSESLESPIANESPVEEPQLSAESEPAPSTARESSVAVEEHAQGVIKSQLADKEPQNAPTAVPPSTECNAEDRAPELTQPAQGVVEEPTLEPTSARAADKRPSVLTIEQQIQAAIDSPKTPLSSTPQVNVENPAAPEPASQITPVPVVNEEQLTKERAEKEAAEAKAREDAIWAEFEREAAEAKAREEGLARAEERTKAAVLPPRPATPRSWSFSLSRSTSAVSVPTTPNASIAVRQTPPRTISASIVSSGSPPATASFWNKLAGLSPPASRSNSPARMRTLSTASLPGSSFFASLAAPLATPATAGKEVATNTTANGEEVATSEMASGKEAAPLAVEN